MNLIRHITAFAIMAAFFPVPSMAKENSLAKAKSPYLRLHKDSPVQWMEWGPEALARAKQEDKPLLISIGYFSCHYCRLMAKETFSNSEVVALINEKFIPVMVDRQERPGLDYFYQTYLQVTVGKSGWPMTIFAQPDGSPYSGAGSFIPPKERDGAPGLLPLSLEALRIRDEETDMLEQNAEILRDVYASINSPKQNGEASPAPLNPMDMLRKGYDMENGGFAGSPKFPNEPAFMHLLESSQSEQADLEFARTSLVRMADGALRDHVNGGFFRYSVDEAWAVPWLEKTLSRNATMTKLYTRMYSLSGDRSFLDVAVKTAQWVLAEFYRPGGGFWSSQYSDGSYYLWSRGDAIKALGQAKGTFYADRMGLTDKKTVPFITHSIETQTSETPAEIAKMAEDIESANETLANDANKNRAIPVTERMAQVSWSALMAESLLHLYDATGNEKYLAPAVKTMEFIRNLMTVKGILRHTYVEGFGTGDETFLEDYACAISLAISLYDTTQDLAYLVEAEELTRQARKIFSDKARGGFFFTAPWAVTPMVRLKIRLDGAVPSAPAMMTRNLVRLYAITGDTKYSAAFQKAATDLKSAVNTSPANMWSSIGAVEYANEKTKQLILVGGTEGVVMAHLFQELRRTFIPYSIKALVQPNMLDKAAEPFRELSPVNGEPALYLCRDFECEEPIAGHQAIRDALEKMSRRLK